MNPPSNKPNSLMMRLKQLRIQLRQETSELNNDEEPTFRRSLPTNSTESNNSASFRLTRSSIRQSLKKMHTRMKNCVHRQNSRNNTVRHTIHVANFPRPSNVPPRISLASQALHNENVYSLDPLKEYAARELRKRIVESPPTQSPPELPDRPRHMRFSMRAPSNSERQNTRLSLRAPTNPEIQNTRLSLRAPTNPEIQNTRLSLRAPTNPEIENRRLSLRAPTNSEIQNNVRVPTDEILSLSKCFWYWGPLTRLEAEKRLQGTPDGTFLIRDSSSTSYLFTISFRSVGQTLHCRIEYNRGRYSLFDQSGYETVTELIEKAMEISAQGIYCYSYNRDHDNDPNFPVRLTKPISRYMYVRSLKYLCRFVIRQRTNINDIPKLPLPPLVKGYLQQEGPYF